MKKKRKRNDKQNRNEVINKKYKKYKPMSK